MDENTVPEIPIAGIVYGETVYWGTIAGSLISIVGATMAMLGADCCVDPSFVFSAIWDGQSTATIWETAMGRIPNGHWYLSQLGRGDSIAMLGLAMGVFSVVPGMIASAVVMLRKKEPLFAVFALIAAGLCCFSCLGVITMPS